MEKTVRIDGKEVRMRASALIPRLYRYKFGRDIVQDMQKLRDGFAKAQSEGESLSALDLEVFENVAWLMMRHAGEDIPDSPEEWLDSMDGVFSVYEVLPAILELWGENYRTTAKPKKK
jgi:hypothetical protein